MMLMCNRRRGGSEAQRHDDIDGALGFLRWWFAAQTAKCVFNGHVRLTSPCRNW